jgi:hypothetical protein
LAENPQRRRTTDNVPPDVLLAIKDGDDDNRHFLRNEFTAEVVKLRADLAGIGQLVQAGNLAQVTENARIQATLEEVKRDVVELKTLPPRVTALEAKGLAADEVAKLKRWFVGFALGIPAAILAATVFLAQHVH